MYYRLLHFEYIANKGKLVINISYIGACCSCGSSDECKMNLPLVFEILPFEIGHVRPIS